MTFPVAVSVAALSGVMFLRMCGVFIVLPLIAVYAYDLKGSKDALIAGMALGAYGVTQALMQIPTGMLADRWGAKPVMAVALLLFAGGGFIAAWAQTAEVLIMARLLQGSGAVASVASAWLTAISPADKRTQVMAIFGSAIGLAFVFSLFVATPLAGAVGINGVFVFSGCAGVLAFVITILIPAPPHATASVMSFAIVRQALNSGIKICALGAFVLHYTLAMLFLYLPFMLNNTLALQQHWQIYAPSFFAALFVAVPLIAFADRRPALTMLVASALIPLGLFFIFALGHSTPWLFAGLFLFFSGFIVLEAAIPARAGRAALANRYGLSLGIVMTCQFLGIFAGGVFSGLLSNIFDITTAVIVAEALLLTWFAVLLTYGRNDFAKK